MMRRIAFSSVQASQGAPSRLARCFSQPASSKPHDKFRPQWNTTRIQRPMPLALSSTDEPAHLPELDIAWKEFGRADKPVVYIMPSMSHSAHVTRTPEEKHQGVSRGWWEDVVGHGPDFGINLDEFRVICAAALGAPYGSSSPLTLDPRTSQPYRASFPQITPADQARAHAYLMDELGISKVHAIVGASMGGMQVLQFAAHFPARYSRAIGLCCTGKTSPSTVALRSVQRAAVQMDPGYQGGNYERHNGPMLGMGLARQFGTICYRSREEFDMRFDWAPDRSSDFEIERYLHHAAEKFKDLYDANCYLLLSKCMDLMDIGAGCESYKQGVSRIPSHKHVMLLSYKQDSLIPAREMAQLAGCLGAQGTQVHYEELSSLYGHDAFLKEFGSINPRIQAFLHQSGSPDEDGVTRVRRFVASIL